MAVEIDTSAYVEEARELLSELEDSLLELEASPEDADLIGRVFRAMHTIKGSGAMFGFDQIAKFTHEVETIFDMARNRVIPVTKGLIDLTLEARDQIRAILEASTGGVPVDEEESVRIIAGLKSLTPEGGGGAAEVKVKRGPAEVKGPVPYRIRIQPHKDLFANGTNPLLLLNELSDLGAPFNVVANLSALPGLDELDPEACFTGWEVFLTTDKGENAIRDVFIFVEDECDLNIRMLTPEDGLTQGEEVKKLGEILVERGAIQRERLENFVGHQAPLGERLVQAGLVPKDQVQAALAEQKIIQEKREQQKKEESAASVRVPSEKLDVLVNLVGELVTVQARLNQTAALLADHNLQLIAEEIERLTGELRDNTMSIRMLPIGSTFNKFKRLVRDLSKELGKQVEMTTEGADTELDKTVIDQLNDPLVHIIRNSIDHGIESPAERVAAGKSAEGRVHLAAEHSGASVLIKVEDDGKGLDVERIRAKGIEKGLIPPDGDVPEKEIFNLIFAPGFSTAAKITNVSGRGVGMDVVRRSIDALRGTIEVDSRKGYGSTITLRLPLTLAIIEGLLVQIGSECFVLPLAAVEECVELSRKEVDAAHGRHMINVRGEIVPYIRIRDRFQVEDAAPEIQQIVIAEVDDRRVGFVVDHVIGQHQTVIKSLGKSFSHSEEFSGATILGDGSVALILDLQKMVRFVEKEETDELSGPRAA
ncbi:MAG: chemotaxis protein CheA [Magnetococcales bacterium]|nr:chemotaxis protein CheA [Magnetococcales bacterium]